MIKKKIVCIVWGASLLILSKPLYAEPVCQPNLKKVLREAKRHYDTTQFPALTFRRARQAAWLPKVSFRLQKDADRDASLSETLSGVETVGRKVGASTGWEARFEWDLRYLVHSRYDVSIARMRISAQQNRQRYLEKIIRLYFRLQKQMVIKDWNSAHQTWALLGVYTGGQIPCRASQTPATGTTTRTILRTNR